MAYICIYYILVKSNTLINPIDGVRKVSFCIINERIVDGLTVQCWRACQRWTLSKRKYTGFYNFSSIRWNVSLVTENMKSAHGSNSDRLASTVSIEPDLNIPPKIVLSHLK